MQSEEQISQPNDELESQFFIVRSTPNREDKFLDAIYKYLSKKENTGIYAVMKPEMVKGYIFVEGEDMTKVVDAFRNIPNSKGVIISQISFY